MRPHISRRLRKEVWEYHIGKHYQGKCYVKWCANILESLGSWHVGHNKAWVDGGENTVENLFPLCGQCNLSMRTTTVEDFSEVIKPIKKKHICFYFCCGSRN